MRIIIHRGSQEIGGNCIELAGDSERIFLDIGLPLSNNPVKLPDSISHCNGILISHSHADHYGLIDQIPTSIPLYCSSLTEKVIQASRIFAGKPLLKNQFIHFSSWKEFEINGFSITPYLMDHSAADSFAFLIRYQGKSLFYSGDFRASGRKSVLFDNLLNSTLPGIDVLFMEGTSLGSKHSDCDTEKMVERKIIEAIKNESGPSFLLCSAQNLDRIVSGYKAAIKTDKIFVVDIYTAWLMKIFSTVSKNTPRLEWDKIKVLSRGYSASRHYQIVKGNPEYFESFRTDLYAADNQITIDEIKKEPSRYFIKNNYVSRLLKEFNGIHSTVIYSMWAGYLLMDKKSESGKGRYSDLINSPVVDFKYIHTSGHAPVKDLKRLADMLNPGMLIPVHTEHSSDYSTLFKNVVVLTDNQELTL